MTVQSLSTVRMAPANLSGVNSVGKYASKPAPSISARSPCTTQAVFRDNLLSTAIKFTGKGEVVVWVGKENESATDTVLKFNVSRYRRRDFI
jgi:hypothetical protein